MYSKVKGGAFLGFCQHFMKNYAKVFQKTSEVFITILVTSFKKALRKNGKIREAWPLFGSYYKCRNGKAMKKPIHTPIA